MPTLLDTSKNTREELEKALFEKIAGEELLRIQSSVKSIVNAVHREGDKALVRLTKNYDKVSLTPADFRVPYEAIQSAYGAVSAAELQALKKAHKKIVAFHKKNLRKSWSSHEKDGTMLGQKITPIEKVGVYCPGGKAFYPSSVLMNIVPAKIAGCRRIVMVSPPSYTGKSIHPALLVAADIAGATDIFRVGGAQAIAALAFGTEAIPKVDKVVGPGNIFVALAKRLVSAQVAIDMEAGPSEILIIADSSASARYVAADMLSQAEHDEMAAAILLTTSKALVRSVLQEIERQAYFLERREIVDESLRRNAVLVICKDINEAVDIANRRAPEHLELLVKRPERVLEMISNAGVVFLGEQTPNAVGDYFAGPNHVLPTGGRARFSSPLTVEDFRKVTNIVKYSSAKLRAEAADIITIAEMEGLSAHANAIRIRMKK
jgi:histidinol dehydrogenase